MKKTGLVCRSRMYLWVLARKPVLPPPPARLRLAYPLSGGFSLHDRSVHCSCSYDYCSLARPLLVAMPDSASVRAYVS